MAQKTLREFGFDVDFEIGSPEATKFLAEMKPAGTAGAPVIKTPTDTGVIQEPFKGIFGPKDIVSDTSDLQTRNKTLIDDITKALTDLGIEKPAETDTVSTTIDDILKSLKDRQAELSKRETEDITSIEKGFGAAGEELKISQRKELEQAEGRTRIGGFFTAMERDEIMELQRSHRLELVTFEGKRQEALRTAKRAYDDQDYQLAQDQLKLAKDIEENTAKKKQDYFDNVIKTYNFWEKINEPVIKAEEKDQAQMLDMMKAAPSAFTDIKPSDIALGKLTYGEILKRYLDSAEYAAGVRVGEKAPASVEEFNYLKKNNLIPKDWSFLQYQQYKATQYGTEKDGGKAYDIGGQKVSALTLDVMGGSINLSDLTASQYEDVSTELRQLGFYSNELPKWFENYIQQNQPTQFANLTPVRKFQKLANLWEATRQEVISSFQKEKLKGTGEGTTPPWLVAPK